MREQPNPEERKARMKQVAAGLLSSVGLEKVIRPDGSTGYQSLQKNKKGLLDNFKPSSETHPLGIPFDPNKKVSRDGMGVLPAREEK